MENVVAFPQPAREDDQATEDVLAKKRRHFRSFEENKRREIEEQREHRRYYFDKQWTDDEINRLRKRGQAPVVRNRIKRKVDFLVGVEQRMRRDPKAYARTPHDTQSADVATAALRFACEVNRWEQIASNCANHGLVSGVGVAYVGGMMGKSGPEVKLKTGQVDRFFYDPRSEEPDFSDARFMGMHLWLDLDDAIAQFPDKEQELRDIIGTKGESFTALAADDDRDQQWGDYETNRVRVVEFWQRVALGPDQHAWTFCFFSGDVILDQGASPFLDEDGMPDCPYVAWSPYVDERGDRHGIVRSMLSVQEAINHLASKIQHRLSTRQFFYKDGSIDDIDEFRAQMARPDGVMKIHGQWGVDVGVVDQGQSIQGEYGLLELNQSDLENIGPNPGLIGKGGGVADQSGKALQTQRDSGMTELSPVFDRLRDWKLRVYRKIWARIRQFWTGERFIRITDNPRAPEYIGINQYQQDPMTGQIRSQNVLAEVDVDIILDEGPDTITTKEEILQTLSQMGDAALGPMGRVIIELSDLPNKDYLIEMLSEATAPQGPDPIKQQMLDQEMRGNEAKIRETEARTAKTASEINLNDAKAAEEFSRAQAQFQAPIVANV